jgi:hypothetical protein
MVVPSESAMQEAAAAAPSDSSQPTLSRRQEESKAEWLTKGFFAFTNAIGAEQA